MSLKAFLTLEADGEDGVWRGTLEVGRVANDAAVSAIIVQWCVQKPDCRVASRRVTMPLHAPIEVPFLRRVRQQVEVEELGGKSEKERVWRCSLERCLPKRCLKAR